MIVSAAESDDGVFVARATAGMEGALAADVAAAIETHVAACPRCEAFIASYREMPRIVRDATRMEMPADLEASLLAALRAARGATPGRDD